MGVGVRVETVLKAMPLNEISKKKKERMDKTREENI